MAGKLLDETGLAELWSLIKEGDAKAARIATGSYKGTGTSGANNPNTLTFDFEPKLVFIAYNYAVGYDGAYFNYNDASNEFIILTKYKVFRGSGSTNTIGSGMLVKFDGKTVSWYTSGSSAQGNDSGTNYRYTAIG